MEFYSGLRRGRGFVVVQHFYWYVPVHTYIGVLVGRWEGCHLVSEKIYELFSFYFNLFSFSFLFFSFSLLI